MPSPETDEQADTPTMQQAAPLRRRRRPTSTARNRLLGILLAGIPIAVFVTAVTLVVMLHEAEKIHVVAGR